MAVPPLSGIHALELGQGVASPYCGKLLAEFGAQVTKIEPLQGDWARRQGPFAHDHADPEGSLVFLYLNTAKHSLTLHRTCRSGQRLLRELAAHADVLISDQDVAAAFPAALQDRLIRTIIRPFGQSGPDADRPATEITLQASGGVMAIVGDPDRHPLKLGGEQAHYLAGLNAAVATLLALEARQDTGRGQVIDISVQESLLTVLGNIPILYTHLSTVARRLGSRHHRSHPTAIFPCRDGFVGIAAQTPQQWEALCLLVDQPELLVDPRFVTGVQRVELADELDERLWSWFRARSRQEVLEACQARRIPVGLSLNIAELIDDPQYAASGFFQTIAHPSTGAVSYPGGALPGADIAAVHARAPFLGEHNALIYGGWLGLSPHERARLRAQGVI
jgi:CoA:oxalate CoA-transferase